MKAVLDIRAVLKQVEKAETTLKDNDRRHHLKTRKGKLVEVK